MMHMRVVKGGEKFHLWMISIEVDDVLLEDNEKLIFDCERRIIILFFIELELINLWNFNNKYRKLLWQVF